MERQENLGQENRKLNGHEKAQKGTKKRGRKMFGRKISFRAGKPQQNRIRQKDGDKKIGGGRTAK